MGYGSIYRNEVPAVLRKSLPIDIDAELPIITDDGVSRDRREQRLDERRKAERVNRERRLYFDQVMRDLKVALSAAIYKAVAGKAKNLVNTWRRAYLLDPAPDG